MSYKAAWQALDTLTNLAGVVLVERAVGGAGGGGAQLTPAARELLAAAEAMAQDRARWADSSQAHQTAAHLLVRTSMRNQWPCVVAALQRQGNLVEVVLAARGNAAFAVHARITRESAELLGLAADLTVQVLCKATAVRVLARREAQQEGVNQWPGRVQRVSRGEAGDEVVVELDGGLQLVGFAPARSGLRVRSVVVASAEPNALAIVVQSP